MGWFARKRLFAPRRSRLPSGRPGHKRVIGLIVMICIAAGLIVYSHKSPSGLSGIRETAASFAAPILVFIQAPLEPFKAAGRQLAFFQQGEAELRRLRGEIQELRGWKWRAKDLERRLQDLEGLARVVDAPGLAFVTSEVLAVSPSVLERSVLINGGSNRGVREGHPVLGADGLVGIVSGVGSRSARVRLVDDAQSRIGISIGPDRVSGTLIGRGMTDPNVVLRDAAARVSNGDEIVTSGEGGRLPRGLRIGRVERKSDGVEPGELGAELYAHFERLDYVSVLFHDVPETPKLSDGQTSSVPDDKPLPHAAIAVEDHDGQFSGVRR